MWQRREGCVRGAPDHAPDLAGDIVAGFVGKCLGHGLDAGDDAERPVIFPGIAHRIDMRADDQRFRGRVRAGIAADDAAGRVDMRGEISSLHRRLGNTMIYLTHDQVEAMTMADRIVVMKDGRIVAERPAAQFTQGLLVEAMGSAAREAELRAMLRQAGAEGHQPGAMRTV